MAKIGFIGLGHMGLPMAYNLLKAGHQVVGFDLQARSMASWVNLGGLKAQRLIDAACDQDIVITMLQTGEQVKAVCLDENGLFQQMTKKALFIDCSSIDANESLAIHQRAAKQSIHMLDAPVSGGVAGAKAATLTFMVGGREADVKAAKPILSAMGKTIIHTGGAASGQAAKLCNNMILGISMIAISEAFILASQLGLTAEKLHEVVTHASGQCWAMSHYVPVPGVLADVPANQGYEPGFSAAMMLKDLNLSQNAAHRARIETPLGQQATILYQRLIDSGMGHLDFSSIINLLSDNKASKA